MTSLDPIPADRVYWLELQPDSTIWTQFSSWLPYIRALNPEYAVVQDPLHCTLHYDPQGVDEEYNTLWSSSMLHTEHGLKLTEIYCGPEGVASEAHLNPQVAAWYHHREELHETAPHVSLMVSPEHLPKDLGPMVKRGAEALWFPTNNPSIHHTKDGSMTKLSVVAFVPTIAQEVVLDRSTVCWWHLWHYFRSCLWWHMEWPMWPGGR
ncbi:hypothetical protein EYF80_052926 [Liparis tanakae]|uniref:Uncharacterized protein n=1 Tax=Liparis tanakae TaxID=230148 RepID=A0A4Z2F7S2_9TELE|nr:hypothetical protein EYF80_052926 [Liparis tanakae]